MVLTDTDIAAMTPAQRREPRLPAGGRLRRRTQAGLAAPRPTRGPGGPDGGQHRRRSGHAVRAALALATAPGEASESGSDWPLLMAQDLKAAAIALEGLETDESSDDTELFDAAGQPLDAAR